jgi:N-acetylmuramoyl-L-alanine amidase
MGQKFFSEAQITSLMALLKLKKEYNIPTQNIIGHSDIAPSRKTTQAHYSLEYISRKWIWFVKDDILQTAPLDFNSEQALRIIGYDTQKIFPLPSKHLNYTYPKKVDSVFKSKYN